MHIGTGRRGRTGLHSTPLLCVAALKTNRPTGQATVPIGERHPLTVVVQREGHRAGPQSTPEVALAWRKTVEMSWDVP